MPHFPSFLPVHTHEIPHGPKICMNSAEKSPGRLLVNIFTLHIEGSLGPETFQIKERRTGNGHVSPTHTLLHQKHFVQRTIYIANFIT